MGKLGGRAVALLGAALSIVAIAACGEDDDDGGGGGGDTGGEISVGTVGPDNADPVLIQTLQAVQPFQLAYTGLVTYAHEEGRAGTEIIPGLAEEVPEPTNGGRTYAFKLRDGLVYSDGSPVEASDFENTIKRLLKLGSAWSGFYTGIVGAADFAERGDFKADIPGIETNDETREITVTLEEPDTKILHALAQPYAAPTPAKKSPARRLEQPPPGVGPYTLEVVDFNREWVARRNRRFPDIPGIPRGNFDTINIAVGDNVTRMTQDVISGELDFMTEDPTGDQLPEVRRRYADRLREVAYPPNVYYFFLNVTLPPFDTQAAREAVNYALDSNALVRIFGGRLQPGCTLLPPALTGYREYECKYGDPAGKPNMKKARELVEQSGYDGERVTVWTNNKDPRPAIADYYRDVLNQIGFEADTKTLDQQVYFEQVGLRRTRAQTGFTNWYQDYPHPGDFFEALLSSEALESEVTFNQGFVSDPQIDRALDELRGERPEEVAEEWGELDEYVVNEKSYLVPYGYEESTSFFSERMDAENCSGIHPVWKNDWLLFCKKG
jgi:peptide/nickel transport system substrate-binding protein